MKIFNTSDIEAFASALATDLARRFPPASESRTDAGAMKQLQVIMDGLGARAVRFKGERSLGIYGKAKLANTFRWKLKDLGYSELFSEANSKRLVTLLAMKVRAD